jgi:hypothetical protein
MIPICDGYAKLGDCIWIITATGELIHETLTYISHDTVIVNGYHYNRETIKKYGFINRKRAEMVLKLERGF